jgi:group I intron endonuclease
MSRKKIKKIICIYKISFPETEKVYVGSTSRWPTRRSEHLNSLKKDKHFNIYMQRVFNKNGGKINFDILEEFESVENLISREQYWVDFFDSSNKNKGFNLVKMVLKGTTGYKYTKEQRKKLSEIGLKRMSDKVEREKISKAVSERLENEPDAYGGKFNAKTFILQNPEGKILEIKNLCKFCRENDLPYRKIIDVAREASIEWNGWTIPNRVHRKKKHYKFINPDGKIVEVFGLRQFCIENNLCKSTMRHISNGLGQTHKGWRAFFEDGPSKRKGGKHKIEKEDGRIFEINNLKIFCKENDCSYDMIRKGYWSCGFKRVEK